MTRLILDIIIAVAVLNGWWFAALPIATVLYWRLPFYIEIILAGLAYDALFGMIPDLGWIGYIGTITAICVVVAIHVLKKLVR